MSLLEVRNLDKQFGGLRALHDVELDVHESEILGLIGPNGAGKTTLFNVITGTLPTLHGVIRFKGEDITGMRMDEIARRGIGRTFQSSVIFMETSVFDNVFTAFHVHYRQPRWKAFFHTPGVIREERSIKESVMGILKFMGLASVQTELAANLPHGHQRILGICLALALKPALLLLDEPATGMNPVETSMLVELIRKIRERGTTIIIVEHDMKAIMTLCDRIIVLNYGTKIAEGSPEQIRSNEEVIEAYLGRTK